MGSFRRAVLGYRRAEVDAAIAAREARIGGLETEMRSLSGMFLGREREVESLRNALAEANARHDRSLRALETVAMRVEEIHAQARGQATRIRMKALADAVQISRRVKEIADRIEVESAAVNGSDPVAENGRSRSASELFEGMVEVEIGPLGDFSQLVGFEDAAGDIGATSEISVRKFAEVAK
jgi:chromosome segregation ATPase